MMVKRISISVPKWLGLCFLLLDSDISLCVLLFFPVKFIDFKIGEESGYIRFEQPESAQKARAAAVLAEQGGLPVKNFIAILEPVIGRQQLLSSRTHTQTHVYIKCFLEVQ